VSRELIPKNKWPGFLARLFAFSELRQLLFGCALIALGIALGITLIAGPTVAAAAAMQRKAIGLAFVPVAITILAIRGLTI
jgi:hypothetical protein